MAGPFYVQATASLNILKHREGLSLIAKVAIFVLSKVNINRNVLNLRYSTCVCKFSAFVFVASKSILSQTLNPESNLLRNFSFSNLDYIGNIWRDFQFVFSPHLYHHPNAYFEFKWYKRRYLDFRVIYSYLYFVAHFTSGGLSNE